MERPDHKIDIIDKYLRGGMKGAELATFEEKIIQDPELKNEVELQRDVLASMDYFFKKELKSDLQEIEKGLRNDIDQQQPKDQKAAFSVKKSTGWGSYWKISSLAAACVAILLVAFWVFQPKPSPESIFEQHYRPYPNILGPITRSDGTQKALSEAMAFYQNGKYKEAAEMFEMQQNEHEDLGIMLYHGISLLELGETSEAIAKFEKILERPENAFSQPASWYLALTYLKTGDKPLAKEQFDRIEGTGGSYAPRASEILEKL